MKSFKMTDQPVVKITFLFLVLALIGISVMSCDDDEPQPKPSSTSLNKIMALGASRVEGARPEFESFRYELWKLLVDGDWDVDYIGSMTDQAAYPAYANQTFDADHEGRGGWRSGEILDGINDWIEAAGVPDIVLFSSPGGNDALTASALEQTISNVNEIIDILQTANPDVVILIEQLAPGRSDFMTAEITAYFESLQEAVVTIAAEQTDVSSQVITVDMFTGFTDDFLADEVHYNEAGAAFIAERYYEVLEDILQR